jgi:hypothetical protein
MKIRIFVKDSDTGEVLEDLGTCTTDSPSRAAEMYDNDRPWCEKGYHGVIAWETIKEG